MGRWTAKGSQQSRAATVATIGSTSPSVRSEEQDSKVLLQELPPKTPSETYPSPSLHKTTDGTADGLAEEAKVLLETSSLSDSLRETWQSISTALADSMPSPEQTKRSAPSPEVLAAMRSAKTAQDAFVAGLPPAQKEEVLRFIELKKRERKLRSKEHVKQLDQEPHVEGDIQHRADPNSTSLKERQKQVVDRAFWLHQRDRQNHDGTRHVDSTEWKRLRAIGGQDPTLRHYLERAGWDASWPLPEPEGRLLRREGQEAALKRYSPK